VLAPLVPRLEELVDDALKMRMCVEVLSYSADQPAVAAPGALAPLLCTERLMDSGPQGAANYMHICAAVAVRH
jgi:hypothetical protein